MIQEGPARLHTSQLTLSYDPAIRALAEVDKAQRTSITPLNRRLFRRSRFFCSTTSFLKEEKQAVL